MLLMNSNLKRDHKICGVNGRLTTLTTHTTRKCVKNRNHIIYSCAIRGISVYGAGAWSWLNLNASINSPTIKSNKIACPWVTKNCGMDRHRRWLQLAIEHIESLVCCQMISFQLIDTEEGSETEANTAWSRDAIDWIDLLRIDAHHHGNIINMFHLHILISWWFLSTGTRGTNTRWRRTKSKNHRGKERGNLATENGNQSDWIELP